MATVRQHYVPQGYLKGFSEEPNSPFIWIYDKREGRRPSRKSVKTQAYEDYYYSQETLSGEVDIDSIEIELAQTVDNDLPPLIQSIQAVPGRPVNLLPDDKEKLAFFIGLGLTRVPSFRNGINDIYTWVARMGLAEVARKDDQLSEFINKYEITTQAKDWVSLRPMIEMAEMISKSLLQKNWQFFKASSSTTFMTSDNPVVIAGGFGMGPAHPLTEIMLSLRKDLALVCTPKGSKAMEVFNQSPVETRRFNRGIVSAARHKVFSDRYSPTIDTFVKKHSNSHQHIAI